MKACECLHGLPLQGLRLKINKQMGNSWKYNIAPRIPIKVDARLQREKLPAKNDSI